MSKDYNTPHCCVHILGRKGLQTRVERLTVKCPDRKRKCPPLRMLSSKKVWWGQKWNINRKVMCGAAPHWVTHVPFTTLSNAQHNNLDPQHQARYVIPPPPLTPIRCCASRLSWSQVWYSRWRISSLTRGKVFHPGNRWARVVWGWWCGRWRLKIH